MSSDVEYKTFTWRGQTRYRCKLCEFDSYSPTEVDRHVKRSHGTMVGGGMLLDRVDHLTAETDEEVSRRKIRAPDIL